MKRIKELWWRTGKRRCRTSATRKRCSSKAASRMTRSRISSSGACPFRRGRTAAERLADAKHLQGLIDRFGADEVWEQGIKTLGYPPSWMVGPEHALEIQDALEERQNDEVPST